MEMYIVLANDIDSAGGLLFQSIFILFGLFNRPKISNIFYRFFQQEGELIEYFTLLYNQHIIANLEMYVRVIISALLGLFIGWDRSFRHKPAGLKTYTYVSVACTLITLVSIYSAKMYAAPNTGTQMDPMRLAAQIVTGLGFLGAGVILKDGLQVKGLTSAAMIFFAGGVGIGIGAGFYGIVIFSVLVTFLCAHFSSRFEEKSLRRTTEMSHGDGETESFSSTHQLKEHG